MNKLFYILWGAILMVIGATIIFVGIIAALFGAGFSYGVLRQFVKGIIPV